MILPTGMPIDVGMVLAETLIGVLVGDRLPERMRKIAIQVIESVTVSAGMRMALATQNVPTTRRSCVTRAMIGERLRLETRLESLRRAIEARLVPTDPTHPAAHTEPHALPTGGCIARGFATASLLFCVGLMAVPKLLNDGISGDYLLLAIKSLMDGIASTVLASALGWGVALSIVTLIVVQGGTSVGAALTGGQLVDVIAGKVARTGGPTISLGAALLGEITAIGGVTLPAPGLLLLDLKRIRAATLLPALLIGPAVVLILFRRGARLAP